jgi:signal transduction histidine kinase
MVRNHELERLRGVETDQVGTAERTRIARELHDIVAHHISAVVIRAQAADRVADGRPEETREAVRWIAASGRETLAAMRHVVRVLRSTETGGSLAPQTTLAELPEIVGRMTAVGLPVELRLPSAAPVLPAAVELAAVRIIQEALTNVLVHAQATKAIVDLSIGDDEIRVEVHDDGSAASPPTMPIRRLAAAMGPARPPEQVLPTSASLLGGNGLTGMRERAASCGGVMSIGTSPLGGWMVSAVLRTGLEESLPDAAQAVKVDR